MIDRKVVVIVPAYNEAASIESVVRDIVDHTSYDIVVVNDGSTDDTAKICSAISELTAVLNLPSNLGIGGAVQAGYKFAFQNDYDIAIQFDGDGQHDASYLPHLVLALENSSNDLVVGSRFVKGHESLFRSTFMRRVGICIIRFLIKLVTREDITDPTSGFRAANKKAISYFCQTYPVDYPEPESVVSLNVRGMSVGEIPVEMHSRQGGSSSIKSLSSIYYMVKVSLAILIQASIRRKGGK